MADIGKVVAAIEEATIACSEYETLLTELRKKYQNGEQVDVNELKSPHQRAQEADRSLEEASADFAAS
jgi:hypothetical protein